MSVYEFSSIDNGPNPSKLDSMSKIKGPPVVLPEHIRFVNEYFRAKRLHSVALYIEIVAYPGITGIELLASELKNVDFESQSILGVPVLPKTMERLVKHVKNNVIKNSNQKLFDFSRQYVHKRWKEAVRKVGMSRRCTIKDLKIGFLDYLRKRRFNYRG